jgi:hypothetical protein
MPATMLKNKVMYWQLILITLLPKTLRTPYQLGKGKVTPKQAYVALRGPGG